MYFERKIDQYLKHWKDQMDNPWLPPGLYFWHGEACSANAEVDCVCSIDGRIFPVELKPSGSGRMQSLRHFLEDKHQSYGYHFSLENFSEYGDVKSLPLYCGVVYCRVRSVLVRQRLIYLIALKA
jgi:hypothetical protein